MEMMMMINVVVSLVEVIVWQCPSADSSFRPLPRVRISSFRMVFLVSLFVFCEIRSHGVELVNQGEAPLCGTSRATSVRARTKCHLLLWIIFCHFLPQLVSFSRGRLLWRQLAWFSPQEWVLKIPFSFGNLVKLGKGNTSVETSDKPTTIMHKQVLQKRTNQLAAERPSQFCCTMLYVWCNVWWTIKLNLGLWVDELCNN